MIPDVTSWRSELNEILAVCEERASLPAALPHCAICARYATDNLPFEALLSLLEVVPTDFLPEALSTAERRLAAIPPVMRQQQVDAITLPVLMETPGWPLVRSLVIDMAQQEIRRHFNDPRLSCIEDVTLLGFAYGGCEVDPEFNDAFFNASSFSKVRSLSLHSTESDADMSKRFWASPMARRLESIAGVPYCGDSVSGPLAVRELHLTGYRTIEDEFTLRRLLDPETSPHLSYLSLGASFKGVPAFLQLLGRESKLLERIETVALGLMDFHGEQTSLLRTASLPGSVKSVTWYSDFGHVSIIRTRDGCDIQNLYDRTNEKVDIRMGDQVTAYTILTFDWRLRDGISRRVQELSLLLPLEINIADVIEFCAGLPDLQSLTLVYPFTQTELETLLRSDVIRRLNALTLSLSVNGGQWDRGQNEYMQENEAQYHSAIPSIWLFSLAFSEATASIPMLSLNTRAFQLTRSPERVHHCTVVVKEAAYALAECAPQRPIEVLCFDFDLVINARLATALVQSGVLGRVYRLSLRCQLNEAAGRILADCAGLRTVRGFSYCGHRQSKDTIAAMLHSPHLAGAWSIDLALPDERTMPGGDELCASSPLLDKAVVLGLDGPRSSHRIPRSGRLARVRRVSESLYSSVFEDGRIGAVWAEVPLSRSLRAKVRESVERIYRVAHPPESQPELEAKLLAFPLYKEEVEFEKTLRDLLATAFAGKPVPETTLYADLNEQQQRALRTIAQVESAWWGFNCIMHGLMKSYGFPFWSKERLEAFIAGIEPGVGVI